VIVDKRWVAIGAFVALLVAGISYAQTVNQIIQAVYDSANDALRVNQVAP
jgi:hypothetical protein